MTNSLPTLTQDPYVLNRARRLYDRLYQILVDRFETVDRADHDFAHALELYAQLAVLHVCVEDIKSRLSVLRASEGGCREPDRVIVMLLADRLREAM